MPKSTNATKVTDSRKPWNRKSKSTGYRIDTISQNKTFLIVCEGQTEALYFESFPVLGATVKVVNLKGQANLKLVEATEEIIKRNTVKYDSVWCVFDMDIKEKGKQFSDFDNSIEKAKNQSYKVAYSNDSFELWLYLHLVYTEAQHLRDYYNEQLGNQFGLNYEKEGKREIFCSKLYEKLKGDKTCSQENAIKRGKRLFNKLKDLPYHKQNPVTTVFQLVEELNENLRK